MGTIVAAYQPHYLPQLHYLARAQQADVFVIYDDVQFVRQSPHHRAPVGDDTDEWLTVPVQHTGVDTPLVGARIDMSTPWMETHLDELQRVYGPQALELAPFYDRLSPPVLDVEFLRNNTDEVRAVVNDDVSVTALVDTFTDADAEWRRQRAQVDDLRAEKNLVGAAVGERKRTDPSADISDLVAGLGELDGHVGDAEGACRAASERRNAALVDLSAAVAVANGHLEWMDSADLWTLDGLDVPEMLDGVAITDLTVPLLEELLDRFDVTSEVVRSSELDVVHPGDASEYLVRLTEEFDGDCYLSGGTGYENYLDETPFEERGLDVVVQNWEPTWPNGNVCALDVLYGSDDPGAYIR